MVGVDVVFPAGPDGRRSTGAVGRAVVAAALRPVDPAGATAVERATSWRGTYVTHFRRLVEAGLGPPADWVAIATAGLAEVYGQLRVVRADGGEAPLAAALTEPGRPLPVAEVRGGDAPAEFALPYRGELLRGDGIRRVVDGWVSAGVAEPSVAAAVEAVLAEPDRLRLEGRTVAALGAGAELGPVPALLRWGATVAAVDLPGPRLDQLREVARRGAGRLLLPGEPGGVDLLAELPAVADWLAGLPGRLVVGNYTYADGGRHVRLAAGIDALTRRVRADRPDLALAFLATPTDVFAVPGEAVHASAERYAGRSARARLLGATGRLLRPNYPPGADPGVNDSLIPAQGPNYALAKRIQRWRATVARDAGDAVSLRVAPSTRTRSVVSNRALRAAFAGAHHFGVEVFAPDTASTLLAALLAHDLTAEPPRHEHPWRAEAHTAVHGGLWRIPYAPRTALPLAAALGSPAALRR